MRASARERAHRATLFAISVENVNRPARQIAPGSSLKDRAAALAENPCIAAGLGLKLVSRLGCRPALRDRRTTQDG